MSFQNPSAFYILFGALLILLLHFLRSRERRREVSALFLWEGLPGDPQSKAAQLRQHIDPLLLLQLAILAALTLALTQPLLPIPQHSVSGLAIVVDGSTSMRTQEENGGSRYDHAIERAINALSEYSADKTVLIQFSEYPQLMAHPGESANLEGLLRDSEPTWFADGTADDLLTMMGSVGGAEQFERILVFSDHPIQGLPAQAELFIFDEGNNVGITAFSVRQNVTDYAMSAFVEILNDTNGYIDTVLRISDGENQTTLALMLEPTSVEQVVIPFPNSRGTVFTATLEHADAFPEDNQRYFALERPIDIRIFWVGERNRYMIAALRATAPVTEVRDIALADLVIVNQSHVPPIEQGVALLIHSSMDDVLTLGNMRTPGEIVASMPDHPLLRSIDASDFRIRELAEVQFEVEHDVLLDSEGFAVLAEVRDSQRRLFFLMADLMNSNLPVTVDFPILIRNLANELVRIPAELSFEAPEVGDFISLEGRGSVKSLTDAEERPVAYSDALMTFAPPEPGIYTLRTAKGAFALTVNVPASETVLKSNETITTALSSVERSERLYPLWPILLAIAILLLFIEAYMHLGLRAPQRRSS